ncbi:MAG: ABC transporter permease [Candidatus Cyclobacteriaceae bacterium M2_1C_046]
MIYNYFKSAVRYFQRHRFFTILNITGLAIGFAATLLLTLFVWQESSYDNFHEKGDRIARVTMEYKYQDQQAETAVTGALVAQVFSEELPEVEKAVRFAKFPVRVQYEDFIKEEDKFLYADSTFFDIFSFNLKRGNPQQALQGPYKVVLTQEAAQLYFGNEDPIGKSMKINDKIEYEVTGIIEKAPGNSQIKYDMIASFASLGAYKKPVWFNANYFTYLLLYSPQQIEQLNDKVFDFMKTKEKETGMSGENYLTYHLEPLQDVHVYSELSGMEANIDVRYIYIFSFVAILVLLIACVNYMNLSTARAVDRGVEVGIRKVLGAQRNQLFWQYINEAFISIIIAAAIAWIIVSLVLPFFNLMLDRSYTMDLLFNKEVLLIIGGILIILTFGAGAYPSLVMARFAPSKTLKGTFKSSPAGLRLRQVLVVFQFAISSALIICSLIIYKQLNFIQNTNLGYAKEQVIVQNIDAKVVEKFDALKASFKQLPQVEEMTMAYETPTRIDWADGVSKEDKSVMIKAAPVEMNYLKTLNIDLLSGNSFSFNDQKKAFSDSAHYLHQKERSIIINEKTAEAFGWTAEEAIGQNVNFKGNAIIIGVIDNFHFAPLHEKVGPLVLFLDNMYRDLMIRVNTGDMASTIPLMQEKWNEIVPHIPFDPQFLSEEYNALYSNEQRLGQLSLFFTTMTVLLGCLGLLGLAALMISHRTREIGIRKVLGATMPELVNVLSQNFMKLVLIGFIIAIPLSYYFMDLWLQTFSYKIDMPYFIYPLAGGILLVLTLITLSTQTIKAAMRNPADVLKSE